jgi:hypothetical protein
MSLERLRPPFLSHSILLLLLVSYTKHSSVVVYRTKRWTGLGVVIPCFCSNPTREGCSPRVWKYASIFRAALLYRAKDTPRRQPIIIFLVRGRLILSGILPDNTEWANQITVSYVLDLDWSTGLTGALRNVHICTVATLKGSPSLLDVAPFLSSSRAFMRCVC